jgi:hypothetical protein
VTDIEKLLAQHQAIIDAYYAKWLADQRKHIYDFWRRKQGALK